MDIEPQLLAATESLLEQGEEIRHVAGVRWLSTGPARRGATEGVLVATDVRLVAMREGLSWTSGHQLGYQAESTFAYEEMSEAGVDDQTDALRFVYDAQEISFLPPDEAHWPAKELESREWERLVAFVAARASGIEPPQHEQPAEPTQPAQAAASDDDLVRRPNGISTSDLAAMYEAHGLDVTLGAEGDRIRLVVDAITTCARKVPESPFLVLTASLRFRAGTARDQALELCNRLNSRMLMIRCSVVRHSDGLFLCVDHYACMDAVLDEELIAGLPGIFTHLLRAGLRQLDHDHLVLLPG